MSSYTRAEANELIRQKILNEYGTQKAFCSAHGNIPSTSHLSDMLHGTKPYSMKVLQYAGLQRVKITEEIFKEVE